MEGDFLTYALNDSGKMVFVDDVPNGLACNCRCPQCHEPLVAKNGGEIKVHHFAHANGSECKGAYETALHIIAKEIIATEKTLMLPKYLLFNGSKFQHYPYFDEDDEVYECDYEEDEKVEAHKVHFIDVEIEDRNDLSTLQPDCVGITGDGQRIHIEIVVTHGIDEAKFTKIKNHRINCIEIKIPRNFLLDRQKLADYIINRTDGKRWINNPSTDNAILNAKYDRQRKSIEEYRSMHPEFKAICSYKCDNCEIYPIQLADHFKDYINMFKGKLLPWANPLLELSPQEILDRNITFKRTSKGTGVYIGGQFHWIYPKDGIFVSDDQYMLCNSTYKFLKNINTICVQSIEDKDYGRTDCNFFEEQFEYKDQWYVFCSHKKWK